MDFCIYVFWLNVYLFSPNLCHTLFQILPGLQVFLCRFKGPPVPGLESPSISIFLLNQWLCHLLRSNTLPPLRAINLRSSQHPGLFTRRETAPGYLWNMPHWWNIRQCHRSHGSSNPSDHNEFLPCASKSDRYTREGDGFGVLAVQALCSVSGCSPRNVWVLCVCSEFMFLVGSQPQHNLYLPSLISIKWIQFGHFAAQRPVGETNIFWVWNHLQSITGWVSSHLDTTVTTPLLTILSAL